jgi:L-alanine-DL-glutamate epimerase-like enolase superfamily enzyme
MRVAWSDEMRARIDRVRASWYSIPTDAPESDGTLTWDRTVLVLVELGASGATGIGYTYADAASGFLIGETLAPIVLGRDPMAIAEIATSMRVAVRNVGRPGVAAMAISAIDVALWDLKARLLGVSLLSLLGPARDKVPIYGSGGFTSYSQAQLEGQLATWVSEGISRVKMKVGRDAKSDVGRAAGVRKAIGPHIELFVDANGAYTRKQALRQAEAFAELGVRWFEEPVSSDDLEGLRLLRDRAPASMDIAAGEYGYDPLYFMRMLDAGAVDILQADATRCGGITGFLSAGALCGARMLPLSAHCAPSLHGHVACAIPSVCHVEYFYDHARIERMLFDGALTPLEGHLKPDRSLHGLGLVFRRSDAKRFFVGEAERALGEGS